MQFVCIVRFDWVLHVYILHEILNLQVVTKESRWKDLPSWKCEILHVIFTTIHKND